MILDLLQKKSREGNLLKSSINFKKIYVNLNFGAKNKTSLLSCSKRKKRLLKIPIEDFFLQVNFPYIHNVNGGLWFIKIRIGSNIALMSNKLYIFNNLYTPYANRRERSRTCEAPEGSPQERTDLLAPQLKQKSWRRRL